MKLPSNQSPSRCGMTLLELLAVIAIGSALLVLIAPAISSVQTISQKATCISNMKTYYSAMIAYAQDHDNQIVPVFDYANYDNPQPTDLTIWSSILVTGKYLPPAHAGAYFASRKLCCPANPNGYMPGENSSQPDIFKYGFPNYLYSQSAGSPVPGMAGGKGVIKLPRLISMSRKAMLFEGGQRHGWSSYRCDYVIAPNVSHFDPDSSEYRIGDVHSGSSHVLFWDGHVETFIKGAIDYKFADWIEN